MCDDQVFIDCNYIPIHNKSEAVEFSRGLTFPRKMAIEYNTPDPIVCVAISFPKGRLSFLKEAFRALEKHPDRLIGLVP